MSGIGFEGVGSRRAVLIRRRSSEGRKVEGPDSGPVRGPNEVEEAVDMGSVVPVNGWRSGFG